MSEEVTETAVDNSNTEVAAEEVEVTEQNDVPAEVVDSFDLDALIAANFDGDEIMQGEHKIGVPYEEVLRHIPENGRKVIQNLRSSYTRKTQELAAMRKDLEAQKEEFLRQQKLFTDSDWKRQIDATANSQEKHDIWDTEGRQKEIERQAAIMMQKMIAPLQEEVAVQQRQIELQKFKTEHPDLKEYRLDIAKMLNDRPELKLEDAYWLVKGRASNERLKAAEAERQTRREESREGLYKTSNGRNVSSRNLTTPKFKDAWSAYQWHRSQQRNKK